MAVPGRKVSENKEIITRGDDEDEEKQKRKEAVKDNSFRCRIGTFNIFVAFPDILPRYTPVAETVRNDRHTGNDRPVSDDGRSGRKWKT